MNTSKLFKLMTLTGVFMLAAGGLLAWFGETFTKALRGGEIEDR